MRVDHVAFRVRACLIGQRFAIQTLIILVFVALLTTPRVALAQSSCQFETGSSGVLTRNGNNVTVQCSGASAGKWSEVQTLCQDGNACNNLNLSNPPVSSASPQDLLSFAPSSTPVNVTYKVCNPDDLG